MIKRSRRTPPLSNKVIPRDQSVLPNLKEASKTPRWKQEGFFKKGQLVRRRRTRTETRDQADSKWGLGVVVCEVSALGESLHVKIYWQGLKRSTVEMKNNVERAALVVEKITLPKTKVSK